MTDYLEIATLGGMLMENDALLGMNGTGGFGIKDSSTYYMGLRAALNLTPNLSLVAAYYRGYTQGRIHRCWRFRICRRKALCWRASIA